MANRELHLPNRRAKLTSGSFRFGHLIPTDRAVMDPTYLSEQSGTLTSLKRAVGRQGYFGFKEAGVIG
jgi:hypothetical protein